MKAASSRFLCITYLAVSVVTLPARAQDKDKPEPIDPDVPQVLFTSAGGMQVDSFPAIYRDPDGSLQMYVHVTVNGKACVFVPLLNKDEKAGVLIKVDTSLSKTIRPGWAADTLATPVISPNGRKLVNYAKLDTENAYQIMDRDPVTGVVSEPKRLGLSPQEMTRIGFDPRMYLDRGEYSTFSPDGNQLYTCVFRGNKKLGIVEYSEMSGSLVALNYNAATKQYSAPEVIIRAGDRMQGMPDEKWGLRGDVSVSLKGDYYLVVNRIEKDLCILQVPRDVKTGHVTGTPKVLAKVTDLVPRSNRTWDIFHTPTFAPGEDQMIVAFGRKPNLEIVAVPMKHLKLSR